MGIVTAVKSTSQMQWLSCHGAQTCKQRYEVAVSLLRNEALGRGIPRQIRRLPRESQRTTGVTRARVDYQSGGKFFVVDGCCFET